MTHPIDVPDEIKPALYEGRLVIFCGAGISRYTGLPDYKGLVRGVFADCSKALSKGPKSAREPYDIAFHQGQYDKALELLEKEVGKPEVVRAKVIERLVKTLPTGLKGDPYVHRAILELTQQKNGGHYLVTTNFDNRFELAGLKMAGVHDAPRLAPPRPGEWHHATFLHGRIGDHDPNGMHLALTSRDFGQAYLRDAWAARFVVELFREFTVLFIGYGVNDPVMGYLIDALASDMGPEGSFHQAYALSGVKEGGDDLKRQTEVWAAKHIKLIPYSTGKSEVVPENRTGG